MASLPTFANSDGSMPAKGQPQNKNMVETGVEARRDSVVGENGGRLKNENRVEDWEEIPLESEEEKKKAKGEMRRAEEEKADQEWHLIDKDHLR